MKIEIKGLTKPGYKTEILEDGKPIVGIKEGLISIRPDGLPVLITEQIIFDETGHIKLIDGESEPPFRYVLYFPENIALEA